MNWTGIVLWTGGPAGDIYRLIPLVLGLFFLFLFVRLGLEALAINR